MNRYILFTVLLLLAIGLNAQQKLSLTDCREMALKQNETVKISQLQSEKAKAEKAALKTKYLPSLSASATGVYLNNDIKMDLYLPTMVPDLSTGELVPNLMIHPVTGDQIIGADGNPVFNMYAWLPLEISLKGAYMAGLSLEQPLYTGGKIMAGNKMASIGVKMAAENEALQNMNALYEADQSYWIYVSVKEKVKLANTYASLLDTLFATVQYAYETGMVTQNEVLKVQVKQNEVKLQLQRAQSGLELTRMALCRVTGLDFNTAIEATDSAIVINNSPFSNSVNPDVTNRPEYGLMEKQVEMAGQNIKLAKADFLPMAGVKVGYSYIGGIEFGPDTYNSGNVNVMASVKIPIFHWGEGIQKTKSAIKDQEIKQLELEKNSRLMQLEIEQARLNFTDAQVRVYLADESLIAARENLKESNDNYELGMETLPNLLEAQAQWQQANSETIDAKTDYKLKETAYLKAIGELK
ncbi:MAG: TolC family protein [Prolixibacteraceae bacterium]